MTKEIRMTKPEAISFHGTRLLALWTAEKCVSAFVIPVSSFIRHSPFGIRHSLPSYTTFNLTQLHIVAVCLVPTVRHPSRIRSLLVA